MKERVLLVEGKDDREVVYQFCNRVGLDNRSRFTVEAKDGVEDLLIDLPIRARSSVTHLGVLIDADSDPNARWIQIRTALTRVGYVVPERASTGGTMISPSEPHRPIVGVWMMPDNRNVGMLEDFLLELTAKQDPLLVRAQRAVATIPTQELRFKSSLTSKAVAHTYLAWQEEPGTPLGQALTKRYLDPEKGEGRAFLDWLEKVFPQ